VSESAAGWLAAGVRVEWQRPPGERSPIRLNLTLSLGEGHNPQSPELWRALGEIKRAVPGSVRVVVVRGDGPSFSSVALGPLGLDTRLLLPAVSPSDADLSAYQQAFDWTTDPAYVSVAAVQGYALGAGLQLAMGCDLRILTTDAVLALPEVTLGLVPGLGATSRLVSGLGYPKALELAVTGRRFTGSEAHQLGLAQRLVDPAQLDDEVEALVGELLAPDQDAVREIKALLLGAERRNQTDQRAAERAALLRQLAHRGEAAGQLPPG
jgi:enoyl-CoA hydratase/carnithine racemase